MQSFGGGKPKRLGRGPRFLTCHICGQQFGKSSLAIHEKACAKKWRDRESKKPKREQRPVPQKAAALCAADGMGVDEYNALAQKEWDHNLTQCQFCQRTFREEAFKHHQKACGPGNAMKKVGVRANASGVGLGAAARARQRGAFGEEYPSAASSQERIECQYCSRKFAPQSIDRHVQVCAKVKHKPTKPPTSNSAFTDELGVRHGGRGGLATSAASSVRKDWGGHTSGRAPIQRRIAGAPNKANDTKADAGFPGSPNTIFLSFALRPNKNGLPGFILTFQKSIEKPDSTKAGLTKS